MARAVKPFRYRGRWRATITLPNGLRPTKTFDTYQEALDFLALQRTQAAELAEPELGGPTLANLATALEHYAKLMTVTKKGARAELNRINFYLKAAGLPQYRLVDSKEGVKKIEPYIPEVPKGLTPHLRRRQMVRASVDNVVKSLAITKCSQLRPVRFRELMTAMRSVGLSESTIQKEIAIHKHLFNIARSEWGWVGYANPAQGLKLGGSNVRYVQLSTEQRENLFLSLKGCRNPLILPLVELALETTARLGSLLAMTWEKTDLNSRVAVTQSKTGVIAIPLTQRAVQVLNSLKARRGPVPLEGQIFPLSANAVRLAWNGARDKAGLTWLQFKDLRHLGATSYAKAGLNAHELKVMLGHKSTKMAEVYVNLASVDLLKKLDSVAPENDRLSEVATVKAPVVRLLRDGSAS